LITSDVRLDNRSYNLYSHASTQPLNQGKQFIDGI
jgi:hypothetical protein